jgi:hypothetical protein
VWGHTGSVQGSVQAGHTHTHRHMLLYMSRGIRRLRHTLLGLNGEGTRTIRLVRHTLLCTTVPVLHLFHSTHTKHTTAFIHRRTHSPVHPPTRSIACPPPPPLKTTTPSQQHHPNTSSHTRTERDGGKPGRPRLAALDRHPCRAPLETVANGIAGPARGAGGRRGRGVEWRGWRGWRGRRVWRRYGGGEDGPGDGVDGGF